MKRTTWFVLALIAIAVIFALSYEMVKRAEQGGQAAPETKPLQGLITTAELIMKDFTQQVPWTGIVQSVATVNLIALTDGRIEAIQAADESPVRAGATVMMLGGPLLTARQEKLRAAIESLQAQLDLAGQTLKVLQQNVIQQLATTSDVATAQAAQLRLEAELRGAQTDLDTLGVQVHVIAPLSGVFTNRRVNVGQDVKEGDGLGAIIDPNHLRIVASLFAPDQTALRGREAVVRLGAGGTLSAIIREVPPQAGSTGATQVWIEGPQVDERLRPGQTAGGEIIVEIRASPAVPESAVVYDSQEQPYVFVQEQGRYERRSIRLGLAQDGWIEILDGLQAGQAVVTQGAYELLHREFSSQYRVED